ELAGNRPIQLMNRPKRQITFGQGVNNDAKPVDVEYVGKRLFLLDHFFINAKQGFFAATDVGFNAGSRQGYTDGVGNFAQYFASVAPRRQQGFLQYMITIGVDGFEAEVLELAIQCV